jgi:ABC-2 type transport system permease protein
MVQALIMVVMTFGWYDLMETIRTGEVVGDLARPLDLCWYWYSRELGRATYYFVYRCIPIYLGGMILFGLGVPGTWVSWVAFFVALAFGMTVGVAYRVFYNLLAFWLIDARAVAVLATVVALFFAGSYVPLPFLPDKLRAIVAWLPFNGLMNVPVAILLGKIDGMNILLELARQVGWVATLTLGVRRLLAGAERRLIVQGG